MQLRSYADEERITIGAQIAPTSAANTVRVSVRRPNSIEPGAQYDFPSDIAVKRRHTQTGGDILELTGSSGKTIIPVNTVDAIQRRGNDGMLHAVVLNDLLRQASPLARKAQCYEPPQIGNPTRHSSNCGGDDPGLCTDCSGPLAPGGYISCHYSSNCGGDPTDGTGQGIGIFRLRAPEISCYYSFVDGSSSCDMSGVSNTDSTAPNDYSVYYEYSALQRAALLHCSGPSRNTLVFVGGQTPDGIKNIGFRNVTAGRAVVWTMFTPYTFNTAMTAVYFAIQVPSPFNGVCQGGN